MSNETNIPNEDELWDLLSEPVKTGAEVKAEARAAAKSEPKPEPEPESKPEPAAPAAEPAPVVPEAPVSVEAPKAARKIDGFFLACMAGVAAVSVAVTLVVSSMLGGGNAAPAGTGNVSAGSSETGGSAGSELEALQQENAELKAQLELQKEQVLELQTSLMDMMGSEQYLATATTDPEGGNEVLDAQVEAYDILAQIQEAYANFDRAKLEELIPEMDARLQYLSSDALNSYYLILEYVEQPSNG